MNYNLDFFGNYVLVTNHEYGICFRVDRELYETMKKEEFENIVLGMNKGKQIVKKDRFNTVYLFVTNQCNLSCSYCSMRSDNSNLPKEKLSCKIVEANIIPKLKRLNPRKVIVSGGEPLVNNDILETLLILKNTLESKIILQSNGKLLNKQYILQLKDKIDSIEISASHYDNINQLTMYVSMLKNVGIDTVLTYTYQTKNDISKIYSTIDLCAIYDLPFLLHFVDYAGSAIDSGYKLLSWKKRLDVYVLFAKYILKNKYDDKEFATSFIPTIELSKKCSAYGKMIAIHPNSDITLCHSLTNDKFKVGKIFDEINVTDNIDNILRKDDIKLLFDMNNNFDCLTCKFKNICNGMCPSLLEQNIFLDCNIKKIMFAFSAFHSNVHLPVKENIEKFVDYCENEEYLKYL